MRTLKSANEAESVLSAYQVHPSPAQTGACAVIISAHDRSLCTTLRAAEMFTPAHLSTPEIAGLVAGAKYFYIEGYFLTHGIESAMEVAKAASSRGRTVVLNLSAPFIPQFFKVQLEELLPHVDILIGNESEAAAYAEGAGMGVSFDSSLAARPCSFLCVVPCRGRGLELKACSQDTPLSQVASTLSAFSKSNASRPRLVIITQGASSTVVSSSSPSASSSNLKPTDKNPKTYPVPKLSNEKIVDTNGAGDMFAGGFLGALALGKDLDEAIEVGHKLGQMCCGQIGPKLTFPKQTVL